MHRDGGDDDVHDAVGNLATALPLADERDDERNALKVRESASLRRLIGALSGAARAARKTGVCRDRIKGIRFFKRIIREIG